MTEIYYYSGTGFTLKAARIMAEEMSKRQSEEVRLIPIVSQMQQGTAVSRAKKIGLLMPMHAFGLPKAFIEFFKTFQCPDAEYVFALVTRGGAPTRMHKTLQRFLKRQNKALNAFQYATAPNTFDVIYKVHTDDEVADGRDNFENDVRRFAKVVQKNQDSIDLGYRSIMTEFVLYPMIRILATATGYFNLQNDYYADSKCNGCGSCEKMCLSNKIVMKDQKPVWQKKVSCHFCLACLHLCPAKAVQVAKTESPKLDRIFCPGTKIRDIACQKTGEID